MKRFLATVIACAAICTVWAQSRTVRGTVTDAADGSPVVGVAVTVENRTAAAVTGLKGRLYDQGLAGTDARLLVLG